MGRRRVILKQSCWVALFLLSVMLLGFSSSCLASDQPNKITFRIGESKYTVDNVTKDMDASPFIENDRTYIPLRYLGDALGLGVEWKPDTQQAIVYKEKSIGQNRTERNQLIFTVNSKKFTHSSYMYDALKGFVPYSTEFDMDVATIVKDGRAYLPARYVVGVYDYSVQWDNSTNTAIITPVEYGGMGGM